LALTPGTRIGVYQIAAQIGEGGMGQVLRARDTKLDRDVALKILPDAFAHDADRLARFQREAKTLASLNHPNIAAIYGLEESKGLTALVMELVEGDDLSQSIAKGAIPLDEALPIAKQIADALEAAHEQGIIHRDLKPANIKVRADGMVKVLDFGLAKAMEPAGAMSASVSTSSTLTTPAMTQAGMILGTAAYMSPEQARGLPVDHRADIFSFGCVVYEMLTGVKPFEGSGVSDVLAAVLKVEPDWTRLPADVTARLRDLVRRCLEKIASGVGRRSATSGSSSNPRRAVAAVAALARVSGRRWWRPCSGRWLLAASSWGGERVRYRNRPISASRSAAARSGMRGSRPMARPWSIAPGGMATRWMSSQGAQGKRNRARSNWTTPMCWRSPSPTKWRSCAIVNTSGISSAMARWPACPWMAARRVTCSTMCRRPTGRRMAPNSRWCAGSTGRINSRIPSARCSINPQAT
jgi:serine/threonine protein kinase